MSTTPDTAVALQNLVAEEAQLDSTLIHLREMESGLEAASQDVRALVKEAVAKLTQAHKLLQRQLARAEARAEIRADAARGG